MCKTIKNQGNFLHLFSEVQCRLFGVQFAKHLSRLHVLQHEHRQWQRQRTPATNHLQSNENVNANCWPKKTTSNRAARQAKQTASQPAMFADAEQQQPEK